MESIESYLFLAKKFLGGLLMPLPILLILLLWGLLFLLRRKTRWIGFFLALVATALLFVASYPPLSAVLTGPLEQKFTSYRPDGIPADFVVVLGSSQVSTDNQPLTSELCPTAIVRLAEGIRIYRLNPGSKLVFTGYHAGQTESFAEKIKQLAIALGVPEEDILAFTGPKDTAEEAALIAENFADSQLILVTSALHMPRAMALFQQQNLKPIPAPTDHRTKPMRSKWLFPNAKTLAKTQSWLHEQLGLLWAKLTTKSQQLTSNAAPTPLSAPTTPEKTEK